MKKTATKGGFIESWYDRRSRCWITQAKDFAGNQLGDAEVDGAKKSMLFSHAKMVELEGVQKAKAD